MAQVYAQDTREAAERGHARGLSYRMHESCKESREIA